MSQGTSARGGSAIFARNSAHPTEGEAVRRT